ncbi:MAG: histidine phosphatase family protein [Acidobacteriota bacterium]
MTRLVLIRHGAVHPRWRGCCYGDADIGLGARGRAQGRRAAAAVAPFFRGLRPGAALLLTSDLRRARHLADRLAAAVGVDPVVDPALRERHFGEWERRSWLEIYDETGDAMDGMVNAPATWRPPGGETTFGMRDRVLRALDRHLAAGPELTVVVGHGGPIAALRGTLAGEDVVEWPGLVPGHGEWLDQPWPPGGVD